MASQTPDRHGCHCGKSFLRKEHLRRHQATHGGPTFSCQVCGRSFSRSDLLRRHAGIHGGAAAVPDSRRGKACDTCHANKTKCDGGPQCSLCAKRGVACTYGRRDAAVAAAGVSGLSPPKKRARTSPPGANGVSMPLPVPLPGSAPVSPPFTESSGTTPSLAAMGIFAGMPSCVSPAASTASSAAGQQNSSTAWAALQSILRAVAALADCGPHGAPPPPSPVPKLWLSACVDSYFSTIHQRWPVLHGPGTDETSDDVTVVASMVMMTWWLHCDGSFKPLLMEMHNVLVELAFKRLANDAFDPSRPWPMETYQVALLNIIFAFESGRAACIKRSRHLLGLLVAVLRQNGCFCAEAVERERNTHYPGDFVPWVFASVERWKRLAVCTFQVDTYLSMLCNQAPLLRREELDLGLASTFGMWNAFGLHVFFPRHRSEPWRRGALKMSCLDMTDPQLLPSGILVEDVHACLLGAWGDMCVLQQLRRGRHAAAASARAAAVARQLELCRLQLDAVVEAADRPDLHGQYTDFLLRAYAAKELPTEPRWRERIQTRIHSYAFSARMLYHLLSLHLRADVQAMRDVSHAMSGPHAAAHQWQRKAMHIQEWAMSPDSRAALLHAMLVWSTYQDSAPALDLLRNPADPVVYMALSAAAIVLWTWTMNAVPACICGPAVPKIDVGPETSAEMADWILRGSGAIVLHGAAVCNCNAATWLTRFAEALSQGGERWELGSIAANNCLSRLSFP